MRPVTQTILDTGDRTREGNCLQAAVASLLHLGLDDVPHFVQQHSDSDGREDWLDLLCAWLNGRGLHLYRVDPEPGEDYFEFGKTERGTTHVVICRDGRMIHDPHPSRSGLLLGRVSGPYVVRPIRAAEADGRGREGER